MEAQQSKSSDNSQAEAGKRLTHMTEIQSKVYENDTQQLRDQLKFMEELDRKRAKAVNEKATQAVKDYESDGRAREKLILDSSIAEKQKLKNSIEENEVYQNRIAQDVVRTKNDQFSETTARMNRQNAEALKDLQGAFTRERDQTRSLNDATHLAQQRNYDERLAETNDKSAKAIAKQSQEFQAARKTLNDEHATEMKSMKEVVQKVTTTDDPTVVSPAAEASIKRALYTQHQKEMDEKATNTERKISSVRDDFKERIADLEAKSKASDMMIRNAAMAELNQTKASYSQFLEDAEFQKTQALKNKDQTNERQKELLTKNSYRTLESQRRQFEELMESQRFDHADKIQALRNESDFKLKIAYRESAAKYAELSQQFNRRLVEQKEEAQNLLESTKQENAKLLKETERRNQNQMEEQNRNFQQRVQQLELQQKDRERSIAQSYETELDKLRHTNAKLSQTKG